MKKLAILVSILALVIFSCKDSKSKKTKPESISSEVKSEVKVKKVTTLEERKEEGKIARTELNDYLKQIPENLVFKESVVNTMGIKKYVFVAENLDEIAISDLDKWLTEQMNFMVADKWERSQLQENDVISGMIYNSYSFKRPQRGESGMVDMFSLTSVLSPEQKTFTIFVKAYVL